jgi:enoyl-CoA hydratase/carnithine racemase
MGWQHAAYTLLSGQWLTAEEAREAGLVWKVYPGSELLQQTMAVATEIAANPIPSLIATKELMLAGGRLELAKQAHSREVEAYKHLVGAAANQEAVAAFLEKREPNFTKIPGA